MCGISGIFNYSKKNIEIKSLVKKIVKHQFNRGPDNSGFWISENQNICFGHNRLSIIDLSTNANQPFISKDQNLVITFNGEIYNYLEIKDFLKTKKVIFKSNSDTEVILESYKYWGDDFLNYLRGMYAFSIYDIKKKKLILARDPFGIKPLYYSIKSGVFYFASQVKSLLSLDDISDQKSDAGIVSYHLWGHIQQPYTIYKDIKSLEKGSCLIINEFGELQKFIHADIKNEIIASNPLNFKKKDDAISYLQEIIQETVKYHQISDVPLTFLLSSGIDSTSILASSEQNPNCSALTLDLDNKDLSLNEAKLAKETAYRCNIPHKTNKIQDDQIIPLINSFYKNMDMPTNDGLNNFFISNFVKENGSKVMISGLGGDELFFGYPSYKRIPAINDIFKFIPYNKYINNFFLSTFYKFLKKNFLNTKYSGIYSHGKKIEKSFLLQRSLFIPNEIKEILDTKIYKRGWEELNLFENLDNDISNISNRKLAIMYLEIKYYMCTKLLNDADWTSMAHSTEMRTPFVDWFFFKKLLPLLKSNIQINKISLLNIVKNKIPKSLYKRKKTGFAIPHKTYLKKISNNNIKYANPIKDWSLLSYDRYINSQ